MMNPIRRLALSCVLALVVAPLGAVRAGDAPSQVRTVILVRHAEKSIAPVDDPALSAEGAARAAALAKVLEHAGVGAIVTTQWTRTRATAAPLAAARGLEPVVVSTAGEHHVDDVAAAVRAQKAEVVLVVGHSNTVPEIIRALGAPPVDALSDGDYDRLFVVELDAQPPRLLRTRY